MYLETVNDIIEVVTSAACSLDVSVDYVETLKSTGDTLNVGDIPTNITTATTTTVLAAPSASNARVCKHLLARNKHATTSVDVTVQRKRTATVCEAHKVTLAPGECLQYADGFFSKIPDGITVIDGGLYT